MINLCQICEFVLKQDEKTPEIAKTGPVCNNDPFLHIKTDVGVCQLVQAEAEDEGEEEEEVNIPNAKSRPVRKRTTKPDLKGKGIASSQKSQRKLKCLRSMMSHGGKESS